MKHEQEHSNSPSGKASFSTRLFERGRNVVIMISVARMHIVVIASLGLSIFGWIVTGKFLWPLAGLVALDWFLVNLINRVVDLEEDQINRIPGTRWVMRFRNPIWIVGVSLLLSSLVIVHFLAPWCTLWRLAFHGLGCLYNWRLRPGWPRIKELYLLKNIASASGFMITLFGYPLASIGYESTGLASGIDWIVVSFLAAYFFLFELSYEVTYDLRDVQGDQEAGVRTLPVVHGPEWAQKIVLGLCATSSGLLLGGFFAGWIPWRVAVLAVGPMVHGALIFRSRLRGVLALDCIRWTWAGSGLLLLFHLWVFLKLPGVR